ncbi:2Fe-2S iron-sulfur cluster-binding protein [Aestuariivita sp.]|jgi:sarcosine oxidase subunit alpha|uniref:2Fe-2S iron-sulfur cluster-binding protein n=1 Tax=Aestuariivita sp. TaxID=1872407 RepID=UPI00216FBAFD|nr:2Fe-2S iron-sulfur cluster-binding protein [Aestuariivita sp.]MCE8009410.1 FAD-dependent oxidoreductase [Aestuariivita sp.]
MTGRRIEAGGLIDRAARLNFSFDGRNYTGHPGDTLASALLANGVRILGRSFKYHRPRGPWGAWFDDPNAMMNVRLGRDELPNCPATTTALVNGMSARAVNAWPSAAHDIKGGLDLFHRWLGAGFYYKTFMWPNWHLFEPSIRKMAGLGALEMSGIEGHVTDRVDDVCDLLVVGGGAAGLSAARAAAEAGQGVLLVEDHPELGGGLYRRGTPVDGQPPVAWVAEQRHAIEAAGGRILTGTTAYGVYDHGLVALSEDRGFAKAPRLWRMRVRRAILAAGATDRPLTFANNDLPGIMAVEAGLEFLGRHGVLVGQKIALASNTSFGDLAAERLEAAGATVRRYDPTARPLQGIGRKGLEAVRHGRYRYDADVLLASAGWTPLVHLWRHAGGKLRWSDALSAFLPGDPPEGMAAVGAANGTFDLDHAVEEAGCVATGTPLPQPRTRYHIAPHWPEPGGEGRQWIDFQHDVTLKDVEQAARENYTSVEHLKRYTTLGMASDQGKTSNMAGLAAMAAIQGRPIPEVGTTTFRPPFVPVPMELYHGTNRGQQFHPLKRLALEPQHRAAGAALGEYGGWLRPAWYGENPMTQAIRDEALMARQTVGVLDASPLGKIEVMGPDAEAFVNFIYYNTIRTLKPGRIRYGLMLTEGGVVYDDGVIARVAADHFVISCSSSHVDGVTALLESWRQDGNDPDRIFVHDCTAHWATITVTGPEARRVMRALDLPVQDVPHMSFCDAIFAGRPLRIARVSFTGDTSYEMSVPTGSALALWQAVKEAAEGRGGGPIGVEALSVLRAEKGYIMVGKDTDGETMPHDLGFTGPREKKKAAFVGDRSLHTATANASDRRQLVGLAVEEGAPALPTGAHIVTGGERPASQGYVTSSYDSPILGRPIAMALIAGGHARLGEEVTIWHMDETRSATITAACAFDRQGARLDA